MGKDPNKPRGRTTAYAFFVMDEKESYQKENPGKKINFGDFSKLCGKKWQGMDEEARERFDVKAAGDKERYDREMADYVPPPGSKAAKKGKKRKKDPNAPKRPQTAFFVFSTKHREEVKEELGEGARVGDIAKRLGEKWKELTDEDKQEYSAEAKTQKEAYDIAMEEYRQNGAKKAKQESSEEVEEDEENDYWVISRCSGTYFQCRLTPLPPLAPFICLFRSVFPFDENHFLLEKYI